MSKYNRIVFVGQSGTSREPMAKGILEDFSLNHPVEIYARGLVVLFSEPMNQKAEAVLISNGINLSMLIRITFMCSPAMWGMNWRDWTLTEERFRLMVCAMRRLGNLLKN